MFDGKFKPEKNNCLGLIFHSDKSFYGLWMEFLTKEAHHFHISILVDSISDHGCNIFLL